MKTAEEIKAEIREMESTERWKLVTEIKNFPNYEDQCNLLIQLREEVTRLNKDIEFLSKKTGLHDMYLERIK
ncbi:hypothetical protein JYA63_03495 [Fictibacillus nanhaiensis]|uniref:HTH merR-type domain-containing protein n=1 Tax=Fictibacillus nanhaiensis TaxID=742169 RepID=A0ABS2ZKA8_9BACL|nr:hypothetical protein [Fictibacillus nanhaiensis]